MTNFPSSLDTSTTLPAEGASTTLATNHVTAHQNIQDALEAVEAKVGVDSSAVTTSHDYKLSLVTTTDKALPRDAAATTTNKILGTGTAITLGSDAEGDTYYRTSGNVIARLPRGSDNQIYKMNGNVPNWEAEATVVAATESVEGISRLATAAQITAGTASEASYPLVVTPDQLALATPVFNGSGLTNIRVFKNGITTKNAADASTTQNIAHGLGAIPKFVRIRALTNLTIASAIVTQESTTFYNGTTQTSYSQYGNGTTTAGNSATDATAFIINTASAASGGNTQTGVVTFDATNIIITWTKTGSPTGTYQLLWEAQI